MTIGLGAYSAHETHFRTFSVRESLTHCYISEQTPLAAPPGASCKKTHRAASSPPPTPGTDGEQRKVNKQQQTALNMARCIKSQSLTLLEKLDALDADEQAAMCKRLHELAEELQNSIQIRFEAESETGT